MPVITVGPTPAEMGKSISSWIQRATIDVAEDALRTEWARGFDHDPVVITDGMPRRDWLLVKPFGKIEFAARPDMAEAVLWALDQLRKRSPVRSGRYVASHVVLLNGREIEDNIREALANLRADDRVQIVNPQPYARKIENKKTGRGKRKAMSKQARSGVYRVVHRALVARYGRVAFFDFKYVKLVGGVKVWGDQGGRYNRHGAKGRVKRVLRDQVYPAIQIFIKPTGAPN